MSLNHHAVHACWIAWVVSNSFLSHRLQLARLLCPWDSPGKNTGMGCHFLLQGNLPDPGTEPESFTSPALAGRFFTTSATWEALLGTSHLLWEEGSIGNSFICLLHTREGRLRKTMTCLRSYRAGTNATKHFLSAQSIDSTVLSAGHGPMGLKNSSCPALFPLPQLSSPTPTSDPCFPVWSWCFSGQRTDFLTWGRPCSREPRSLVEKQNLASFPSVGSSHLPTCCCRRRCWQFKASALD